MATDNLLLNYKKNKFTGITDCLRYIYKKNGLKGIYKGFLLSNFGIFIYRGIYFGGYDSLKY